MLTNIEKLLTEAKLLNIRINEIYATSSEIHKDLLKNGYHDSSLKLVFNRVYKFKIQLENIIEQLKLLQENKTVNENLNDDNITEDDINYIHTQSQDINSVYEYDFEEVNLITPFSENEKDNSTDIENNYFDNTEKIEVDFYEENQSNDFQGVDYENFEEYENDFEDKYLDELPKELNTQEFDWDNFDDFDELNDDFEDYEITKFGKLTKEQRANQIAVEILKKYDWDDKYLGLLRETFEINSYPVSRAAIERQLKNGMLPEELELALLIRNLWANNEHYWISFFDIDDYNTQGQNKSIGWKYPLKIIRSFTCLPSPDEIQFFIEQAYDDWYSSAKLCEEFQAFNMYLIYAAEFKSKLLEAHGFSLSYNEIFARNILKLNCWYW